jgi:hypothetical protein
VKVGMIVDYVVFLSLCRSFCPQKVSSTFMNSNSRPIAFCQLLYVGCVNTKALTSTLTLGHILFGAFGNANDV